VLPDYSDHFAWKNKDTERQHNSLKPKANTDRADIVAVPD